jgi:hypothetical protein
MTISATQTIFLTLTRLALKDELPNARKPSGPDIGKLTPHPLKKKKTLMKISPEVDQLWAETV